MERYSDPDQDPLSVTQTGSLVCRGPEFENKVCYGKWLFFKNFEDLNETWCVIREEFRSGRLGVLGVKCSTLMYSPLRCGTGPKTTGRINVFTKKEDKMEIGMKLIQLSMIQHDIMYKTMEDTVNNKRITEPLFWNSGCPSLEHSGPRCPRSSRDDVNNYDPSADRWKINVVIGSWQYASERVNGKWIVKSNDDKKSPVNITKLWHTLKQKVEIGEIPTIKMECPPSHQHPTNNDSPEIIVFTSNDNMTDVGKKIISVVKYDIEYVIGDGSFRDDYKTLYWNGGDPGYDQGPQGNWR